MAEASSRLPPWAPRVLALLPWLLVTGLGLALLWPVPAGHMPLSADHTVHLTRISMLADELAQGRLRGWSSTWFFGTPVGELYPVLGDLMIIGLRGLSLGLLTWPQAYALGFTLVFLVQGWALLRVGRALGLGRCPGSWPPCWCWPTWGPTARAGGSTPSSMGSGRRRWPPR